MNNSLRQAMCARMSLVYEEISDVDNDIGRKISHTLGQARQLLRNVQAGNIDQLGAARTALQISASADAMNHALRYMEERLRLVYGFLSEVENTLINEDEP